MRPADPGVITVPSTGQVMIPSRLRAQFGLEKGTKLMVVPTDYGAVLKELERPSVEAFQQRVKGRAEDVDRAMAATDRPVHEAGGSDA